MTTLDIAKLIIKDRFHLADCGLFNSRNTVGDPMVNIYRGERLMIDICYEWEYFEVFGLTPKEFNELSEYYEELKNGKNTKHRYEF